MAIKATPSAPVAAGTPLHGMRKSIADRMLKSLQTTAQLTISTEADVTALVARRERLQAQFADEARTELAPDFALLA